MTKFDAIDSLGMKFAFIQTLDQGKTSSLGQEAI